MSSPRLDYKHRRFITAIDFGRCFRYMELVAKAAGNFEYGEKQLDG